MYSGPLFIASDHRGYQLKRRLLRYFANELAIDCEDLGPFEYAEDDDYPDYAIPLAQKVKETEGRGILICGNGVGVCIVANKIPGIRAGIGYNLMAAETMMTDDNTNVICLPSRILTDDHAMAIIKRWLETPFSGEERHMRRLSKVEGYENSTE